MDPNSKAVEVDRVACEVCLKEVPRSEAKVPEAADYVMYFCGLECYAKWRALAGQPNDRSKSLGA